MTPGFTVRAKEHDDTSLEFTKPACNQNFWLESRLFGAKVVKPNAGMLRGLRFTDVEFACPGHSVVWHLVDRRYFLPVVRDQLFRGSCAVFASLAAMEYIAGVPRLSEAYAYSMLKPDDLAFDGVETLSRMKSFLEREPMLAAQLADEKIPYESIGQFYFDEKKAAEVTIARAFNRVKGKQAALLKPEAIYRASDIKVFAKNQITAEWITRELEGRPLVVSVKMNTKQWRDAQGGVIDNVAPALPSDGGHAVLISHYTPDGYFVFRNSWGLGWGDRGYGYMSMDYLLSHVIEAMEIGAVEAVPTESREAAERFDVRANGVVNDDGTYEVYLSLILLSRWVPGGGIESVEYELFEADADPADSRAQPIDSFESSERKWGFFGRLEGRRDHSFKVCVHIRHANQRATSGCRTVPEVLTWSPHPVVEAR